MTEPSSDMKSPCGRPFKSSLAPDALNAMQMGVMRMTYRGRLFAKSPLDIALYLRLIEQLRPQTVIEIGAKRGGSALWFADMLTAFGINSRVISVDRQPPTDLKDERISFFTCDAATLENALAPEMLATLPRPWLISEDSAHTYQVCLAVLRFFDKYLKDGEYIVIEDGIVSDLPGKVYRGYKDGPNRAVAEFLSERAGKYVIDADLCDHFGYNATYNPNGWLRRTGA